MAITNQDIQLLPQIDARQHPQPGRPITMRRSVSESQAFLQRPSMRKLALCRFVRSDRITALGRISQQQCTTHKTCYKQHKLLWSGHPAFR